MQKDVRKFGISDKRGRRQTSMDPFIPEEGMKEPTLCTGCKAVYQNKRWTLDPEEHRKLTTDPTINWVSCPACQKIAASYPEGIVTLSGSYLWEHEDEIRKLLKNIENKALEKNPIGRVIRRFRDNDKLVIETTERKLAEHLGRAINKAHQGEISISWSQDHDICRVNWERML